MLTLRRVQSFSRPSHGRRCAGSLSLSVMSNHDTPVSGSKLRHALRALRHRNFRLFTAGQSISVIGTWMQQVAVSWLVYRMTGSAFYLGLVGFLGQAPTFVLAPFAGALA